MRAESKICPASPGDIKVIVASGLFRSSAALRISGLAQRFTYSARSALVLSCDVFGIDPRRGLGTSSGFPMA